MTRRPRHHLFVAAVALAGVACGGDPPAPATVSSTIPDLVTTTATAEAPGNPVEVRVVEASIVGGSPDGAARWDVRYPLLEGSAFDDEVNEQLRGDAEAALDAWRREAEGWGVTDELPSEYVAAFEVTLLDDRVVSVMGSGSAYLSGAAHPVGLVSSATFDLTTGERVTVEDLFDPTSAWQEALIAAAEEALAVEYGDSVDVTLLDLGPDTDLSVFALTPAGLRLAFAEGAIGPHALGVPSVTILYDVLDGVVVPDGLAGRAGGG